MSSLSIAHIEDFFHPDAGYHVNIVSRLQSEAGHRVTIYTSEYGKSPKELTGFFNSNEIAQKDDSFARKFDLHVKRLPTYGWLSGRAIYHPHQLRKLATCGHDIIYIHGHSSVAAMYFLHNISKLNTPLIFDCHMLDIASKNRLHPLFNSLYKMYFSPIIIEHSLQVIKVVDDNYLADKHGIPTSLTPLYPLGTDRQHFKPDLARRRKARNSLGIPQDARVAIYCGKITEDKGAKELLELLKQPIIPNTWIVIIGTFPDGRLGNELHEAKARYNGNLIHLPSQTYLELPNVLMVADFAFFPRQCSMTFFDLMSLGIPVILEDIPINRQRVSFGNGSVFAKGNFASFLDRFQRFATMPVEELLEFSRAAKRYCDMQVSDYADTVKNLEELIRSEIKRQRLKQSDL